MTKSFCGMDCGTFDKRNLVFGTNKNLKYLWEASHWFLNGTFKTVPRTFSQLYTVHALINGHTVPLIYILLTDKTQATYTAVLEQLKNLINELTPETAMVDYEIAMINSLRTVFPQTQIKCCFFT